MIQTEEQGASTEEKGAQTEVVEAFREDSRAPRLVVPMSGQEDETSGPEAESRLRAEAQFLEAQFLALLARNSTSFTDQDWQVCVLCTL